ncbi:hypothetical protein ABZX40_17890 [Streptomyces sp. NPDC004610]|uniref:PASTA domain-containing protein n=1 Tax=unclassified Streptomyces TaxID=2593676 RepID=UPI0033B92932
MRTRTTAAAITALLALALAACTPAPETTADEPKTSQSTPAADTASEPEEPAGAEDAAEEVVEEETATLPDLTGQDLQAAQDAAQEAGFYILTSSDATGQERMQVMDRNWIVCSQTPEPGEHDITTTVNFDTVKDGESC